MAGTYNRTEGEGLRCGNVLVTNFRENLIQPANRLSKECWTEVLVTRRHPQVFVAEKLIDGVDISASHPQPTSRSVPQIVEPTVPS